MCRKKSLKLSAYVFAVVAVLLIVYSDLTFSRFLTQINRYFFRSELENIYSFDIAAYTGVVLVYMAFLLLLTAVLLWVFPEKISTGCRHFKSLLTDFFHTLKEIFLKYPFFFVLFIGVNLIIRMGLMWKMPVFVDEAWTFFGFSSKGFLTSMSYYPAPNNHILHSLLTNLSLYLPFDSLFLLRLPALLTNLILLLTFWVIMARLFQSKTALLLTALFAFAFPVLYYGYLARGYSLYTWAFLLLFYASVQMMRKPEKWDKYLVLWLFSSLIGFYTIPSFLYPYATSALFLFYYYLRYHRLYLAKFIQVNLIVIFGVILLYVPVLLVSGYRALIDNPYVHLMSRRAVFYNLDDNWAETSRFLFSLPLPVMGVFFALLLYLLRRKLLLPEVQFSLLLIFFPPVLMLLHASSPMARIWMYEMIPVYFLLGHVLNQLIDKRENSFMRWAVLSSVLVLLQFGYFIKQIKDYESESFLARNISLYLQKNKVHNLFTGKDTYLGTGILFDYKQKGIPLKYVEAGVLNDSIVKHFDYFLLRYAPDESFLKKHQLQPVKFVYKNSFRYLYQKNKP